MLVSAISVLVAFFFFLFSLQQLCLEDILKLLQCDLASRGTVLTVQLRDCMARAWHTHRTVKYK